jgi:hypothetical protein
MVEYRQTDSCKGDGLYMLLHSHEDERKQQAARLALASAAVEIFLFFELHARTQLGTQETPCYWYSDTPSSAFL